MNIKTILTIGFLLILMVSPTLVSAWEPPVDFDWTTPYKIEANCGGGCHIQFGKIWLNLLL